jgi:ABC-2 type transport system ATP-binding protein
MIAAIEVRNVSKRYGRRFALRSIDLEAYPGEILGLIGPNGAGKTTLLRLIARLLRPTSGEILFALEDGKPIRYFGGEQTLPPDVSAAAWLELLSGSPADAPTQVLGSLSRGTRQRLGLHAVLSGGRGGVLLLDEPWEGLDPDAARWLSRALREQSGARTAVVVSSHRLHDLANVCDRCLFLIGGRLVPQVLTWQTSGADAGDRSARLFEAFDRLKGYL